MKRRIPFAVKIGMALKQSGFCGIAIFALSIIALGCSGRNPSTPDSTVQASASVPPSTSIPQTPLVIPLPSPSPTASNLGLALPPTSSLPCTDDLSFVSDLTVPDGTIVASSTQIDKRWQVENTGACNWDDRYRLRLVAGLPMGVPEEQMLFPARSGAQALIRMLFTSPAEPGTYRSAWQAVNPQGEVFGEIIYIQIIVAVTTP